MIADNAVFYCQNQVPFVMGTTGGDRHKLLQDTKDAGVYAVIAPQMGKQVRCVNAAQMLKSYIHPPCAT